MKVWVRVRHGVAAGQVGWISSAESTLPHLARYRIHLENPVNVAPSGSVVAEKAELTIEDTSYTSSNILHLTALDLRAFEFERLSDLEVLALAKKARPSLSNHHPKGDS